MGAIMSADEKKVHLFGYGVYKGREVPPPGITLLGMDLHEAGLPNPRIDLDNGQVVWGCMCWWGPEEVVREVIGDREIVMVDVPALAQPAREEGEGDV